MTADPRDPDDLRILRFELQHWRQPGAKEAAIAEQLGLSPTRYYQRLNHLIDTSAAQAAEPVLCSRLRRLRDRRRNTRAGGAYRREQETTTR